MAESWEKSFDGLMDRYNAIFATRKDVNNSDDVYNFLKDVCTKFNEACKETAPHAMRKCQEKNNNSNCKTIVDEGVVKYCGENKGASVCGEWFTTTTNVLPSTSTSSGPNLLPFIIGGVVGVIVLLAVAIGLFCYCRKKKKMGKNQSMTGTTTGGTSCTGTGTATGTTIKTGTTQATGTNTCAKY
ncbi:unnamed protein product [Caenorhabditis brenneri]